MSCLACVYFIELNSACRKGFDVYHGYSSINCKYYELNERFKKLGEVKKNGFE